MTPLFLLVIAGVGLFAAFLFIAFGGKKAPQPHVDAVTAVGQMIRLGGLSFTNSKRLLDDSEYRVLIAHPQMKGVAKHLLSERRQLVLQWIEVLSSDLTTLWRFRRFLVRRGAPVQPGEEFKVLRTFVFCWALLMGLKLAIRVAGPFALPGLVRQANGFVGRMSDVTASTLGRLPTSGWMEIERSWAAQAA